MNKIKRNSTCMNTPTRKVEAPVTTKSTCTQADSSPMRDSMQWGRSTSTSIPYRDRNSSQYTIHIQVRNSKSSFSYLHDLPCIMTDGVFLTWTSTNSFTLHTSSSTRSNMYRQKSSNRRVTSRIRQIYSRQKAPSGLLVISAFWRRLQLPVSSMNFASLGGWSVLAINDVWLKQFSSEISFEPYTPSTIKSDWSNRHAQRERSFQVNATVAMAVPIFDDNSNALDFGL